MLCLLRFLLDGVMDSVGVVAVAVAVAAAGGALLAAAAVTSFLRTGVPGRVWMAARLFNKLATLCGRRRDCELRTLCGSSGQNRWGEEEEEGEEGGVQREKRRRSAPGNLFTKCGESDFPLGLARPFRAATLHQPEKPFFSFSVC